MMLSLLERPVQFSFLVETSRNACCSIYIEWTRRVAENGKRGMIRQGVARNVCKTPTRRTRDNDSDDASRGRQMDERCFIRASRNT